MSKAKCVRMFSYQRKTRVQMQLKWQLTPLVSVRNDREWQGPWLTGEHLSRPICYISLAYTYHLKCGVNGDKPLDFSGFINLNFYVTILDHNLTDYSVIKTIFLLAKPNMSASGLRERGKKKRIHFIFNHRILVWSDLWYLFQSKHCENQVVNRLYKEQFMIINLKFKFLMVNIICLQMHHDLFIQSLSDGHVQYVILICY